VKTWEMLVMDCNYLAKHCWIWCCFGPFFLTALADALASRNKFLDRRQETASARSVRLFYPSLPAGGENPGSCECDGGRLSLPTSQPVRHCRSMPTTDAGDSGGGAVASSEAATLVGRQLGAGNPSTRT